MESHAEWNNHTTPTQNGENGEKARSPGGSKSKTRAPSIAAMAAFGGLVLGAAALGSVANRRSVGLWYKVLRKPPFQPPRWVFAPVWTGLYGLMAASGYRIWQTEPSPARTRALAMWGTQLALNTAWSPLFFGARKPKAALVDLGLLGLSVGAYTSMARKLDAPAAAMMLPYLGWLGFAGVLNEEIVRRNRGWRGFLTHEPSFGSLVSARSVGTLVSVGSLLKDSGSLLEDGRSLLKDSRSLLKKGRRAVERLSL